MVSQYNLDTSFYNQEVILLLAESSSEATSHIIEKFPDNLDKPSDDGNTSRGFQWKTYYKIDGYEKARFFVVINYSEIYKTTADHELLHLAWDILDHVGIHLTNDNHEALTYFYEYLLEQYRDIIYGRDNKRTKKSVVKKEK